MEGKKKKKRTCAEEEIAPEPKSFILLSPLVCFLFVCLFFSTPIGEWLSPLPTPCRTCRTPPSTATTTAAWRSQRPPAASRRPAHASGPWPCLRTTTRGPPRTEALARPSTLRTVRSGPSIVLRLTAICIWTTDCILRWTESSWRHPLACKYLFGSLEAGFTFQRHR